MNLDMDDDEEDKYRRELAQQIEIAFADVPYPGDDKIIANPNRWYSSHLPALLAGKHWQEIPLNIIIQENLILPLFTPEGFRFYFPAFLRAAVLYHDQVDVLTSFVFYSLNPPEEDETRMSDFLNRINGFTHPQIEVIKAFVRMYIVIEHSYPDAARDRAGVFWEQR